MKRYLIATVRAAAALIFPVAFALAQAPALPDAAGRDVVQRVCGACHPATIVVGRGMTRQGWDQVVASMISRGAKGTPADFKTVTDYLAANFPVNQSPVTAGRRPIRRGGSGPSDKQIVDADAAGRGKLLYAKDCQSCHGAMARGGSGGPDLVRSVTVLHDRYGDALAPYLRNVHPQIPAALSEANIKDLSHFLHQQVADTLRSGPFTKVLNVLTGDARTGEAYFNGPGGCTKCHSAARDLAGVASRYDAPSLQQRMLFPRTVALGRGVVPDVRPVTADVTPADGQAVSGTLLYFDDFNVSLRDASGTYRSWKRTPELTVELHDPYKAHDELLDQVTDKDIHDLVAYLETLK
jgi:mono/diheme cytochrome c family protein